MLQTWLELTVSTSPDYTEAIDNFLLECGASGLLIDDGPSQHVVKSYWTEAPPEDLIQKFCEDLGCWSATELKVAQLAGEDWSETWKRGFEPTVVGQRLCICPPWHQGGSPDMRIRITIDPGMAFGTGQHASTRGCLTLIEQRIDSHRVRRALDVGTGTGILAIALAKLQVPEIWAADIDSLARQAVAHNAEANHVSQFIHTVDDWRQAPGQFDLIAANLFTNLLVGLSVALAAALSPAGALVCSGFLTPDETTVRTALQDVGLRVSSRWTDADWVSLLAEA